MGVKDTVFASKAEKKNFSKLGRVWKKDYTLYHNIPFLNILTLDDLVDFSDWKNPEPISLSEAEIDALKHASIDYVLCDSEDSPLLAIEFDGLQDGFSVGTDYHTGQVSGRQTPWRREKTELKLKVAHGSHFPLFVVGSEHFKDITPHSNLTIVDGVIGSVFSSTATQKEISKGFRPETMGISQEEFDNLSPDEQHDVIQDWVIGVEADIELENNPVSRLRAKEVYRLNVTRSQTEYLQYPAIPKDFSLDERAKLFRGTLLQGARVTFFTSVHGDIVGEAWVPNFNVVGYSPIGLAEDIAALLALDKLRQEMGYAPAT